MGRGQPSLPPPPPPAALHHRSGITVGPALLPPPPQSPPVLPPTPCHPRGGGPAGPSARPRPAAHRGQGCRRRGCRGRGRPRRGGSVRSSPVRNTTWRDREEGWRCQGGCKATCPATGKLSLAGGIGGRHPGQGQGRHTRRGAAPVRRGSCRGCQTLRAPKVSLDPGGAGLCLRNEKLPTLIAAGTTRG